MLIGLTHAILMRFSVPIHIIFSKKNSQQTLNVYGGV